MKIGIGMRKFWATVWTQALLAVVVLWGPEAVRGDALWGMVATQAAFLGVNIGEHVAGAIKAKKEGATP